MKILGALFLILAVSGCSIKFGDFSLLSTKQVEINGTKKYRKGNKKVVGKDIAHIIILFPTKLPLSYSDAVSNALDEYCAEYLTEVKITQKFWFIPYIYGRTWVEAEGYPWFSEDSTRENCTGHEDRE